MVRVAESYRRPITVRFEGPATGVPEFVGMLDRAGYAVECTPAIYQRSGESEPDDMATALLFVSGSGLGKTVSAIADELMRRLNLVRIVIQVGATYPT